MDADLLRNVAFFLILFFYIGVMGSFGSAIAENRGRDPYKGAALAIFLPVLGLLIDLLLPAQGLARVRRDYQRRFR